MAAARSAREDRPDNPSGGSRMSPATAGRVVILPQSARQRRFQEPARISRARGPGWGESRGAHGAFGGDSGERVGLGLALELEHVGARAQAGAGQAHGGSDTAPAEGEAEASRTELDRALLQALLPLNMKRGPEGPHSCVEGGGDDRIRTGE